MYNKFICRKGKIPVDYRTGATANPHSPEIWTDRETAQAASNANGYGIGYVLTDTDNLFFIDVDNALQTNNNWSQISHELVSAFNGAYIEISESARGLHIIGTYTGEASKHLCKNKKFNIELYTTKRYVALTGIKCRGFAEKDCTAALNSVIEKYFKPPASVVPRGDITGSGLSDDMILQKALVSKNPFTSQNNFKALWCANGTELAKRYPASDGIREYDFSSADAALAQHLAFWTRNNTEQIERIMRKSALTREKWAREDYLPRTIARAISLQKTTYGTLTKPQVNIEKTALRTGLQFLSPQAQKDHFDNCVYVQDIHRAFTPAGNLLKPEQFKATYGGYIFALDSLNSKTTTNAWQAFTESQALTPPRANTQCFRPQEKSGGIITENGRTLVNVYVPIKTPCKIGDASPFSAHLMKILPDETDRMILLAYLAACIQHKGVKFQWCPVIQGVEGNGKTFFTRCVAAAIGRKYSHFPKASDLDNKFNSWLLNKLFIGVEDIYVPEDKLKIIETLKPMITGSDGIEIQAKGVDQITADICANFLINSNHRDALRKTHNDRRFCIFYCAQQNVGDLYRDGLHGDYFPKLYEWLRNDGYAIVHNYLATYEIPDKFNPARDCHRAPKTSSTAQAVIATAGSVEQEILEAIGEGRLGFKNGWVSSMQLSILIKTLRRIIPVSKRREIMRNLNYDWHPHLPDGRTTKIVMPDAGRPKLFIKNGHPALNLSNALEIADTYTRSQM